MALLKTIYKSTLTPQRKSEILTKIKALTAERQSRLIIKKGLTQWQCRDLTVLTINPSSVTDTLVFAPRSGGVHRYNADDIVSIQHVGLRKWKVNIAATANPAPTV